MVIVWSDLAKALLKAALEYVEEQFGAMVARQTLEKIDRKVRQLERNPEMGISDFQLSSEGIAVRHLIVHPNVVYYFKDENEIVIIAVMHSKQSPKTVRRIITKFLEQNH